MTTLNGTPQEKERRLKEIIVNFIVLHGNVDRQFLVQRVLSKFPVSQIVVDRIITELKTEGKITEN